MSDDANVGFRDTEEAPDICAGLLVVERHDDYSAFAFFQLLHASRKLFLIQLRHGRRRWREYIVPELLHQKFSSLRITSKVEHCYTTHPEHE